MTRCSEPANLHTLGRLEIRRVSDLVRTPPEVERDRNGVDLHGGPPGGFIAVAVEFAVVGATHRNGKLVTDLSAERSRLRVAQVMRIGR